jgi:hypothetical protein
MQIIEKVCRRIAKEKGMNPDDLACPVMPVFVNAAPLINGFIVPPSTATCKVWQLFEHYVEMVFEELELNIQENGDIPTIELIEEACKKDA